MAFFTAREHGAALEWLKGLVARAKPYRTVLKRFSDWNSIAFKCGMVLAAVLHLKAPELVGDDWNR